MKWRKLLSVLCLLCLCLAAYSGYQFFASWQEYAVGEQYYDELTQFVQLDVTIPTTPTVAATDPPEETTQIPTEAEVTTAPTEMEAEVPTETVAVTTEPTVAEREPIVWPVVDFEALLEINPDVVGWIYIPGTNINYPVVCGQDNEYYLYRLVDGASNKAGSIFMDFRNDRDLVDENTVLYGHHMQNQSMFAHLTKYMDQSFYDAQPYGFFLTPENNYLVEFFSGYVTDVSAEAWKLRFASYDQFSQWLNQISVRSYFANQVYVTAYDRILTLSTCTFDYDDARFVLHGVLREMGD